MKLTKEQIDQIYFPKDKSRWEASEARRQEIKAQLELEQRQKYAQKKQVVDTYQKFVNYLLDIAPRLELKIVKKQLKFKPFCQSCQVNENTLLKHYAYQAPF